MRNNYEFDWNLMVKLDPSYMQYLEDVNKIKFEEDPLYGTNPGDPNIHGFTARELRQQMAEEEVNLDTDYRAKDLSEEERAIVEMMHSGKEAPKEEGGVIEGATLIDRVARESNMYTDDVEQNYRLKAEYRDYPLMPHPDVLMIKPPKRVLAPGSTFWISEDTQYHIENVRERNPDVVNMVKHKIYRKPDKVGMVKVVFRLDRIHDASTEKRKQFRMVVYNLKTAKLYYITGQDNGKHKRVTKKISQMGLNKNGVHSVLSITDNDIATRFVQTIKDHILGLIPDAYVPPRPVKKIRQRKASATICVDEKVMDIVDDANYRANVLYSLMLQHKVGCRLEWLADENFINNVSEFVSTQGLAGRFLGDKQVGNQEEQEKEFKREKAFKAKTMYTVFPKLKKRPGAKTVTRALFGQWHKNIYHQIMTWKDGENDSFPFMNAVGFLTDLSYLMGKGLLPNETYHLISKLVKRGDNYAHRQLSEIGNIMNSLRGNTWDTGPDTTPETLKQAQFYTRTANKMLELVKSGEGAVNEVVRWSTFRDMMNMAQELGIRIRINKFTCANDVRMLHDRFSAFQQRDLEAFNKYDEYEFLPFDAPDKEYEGFRFIQLLTPAELVEEGRTMRHCVGGYSRQCLEGRSLIFSMFKERSWVTIELDGADGQYTIRQKYTIKDFTIRNSSMLNVIEKWHNDLLNMHGGDKEPYAPKALAHYEYQKNLAKLQKYQAMEDDDLDNDERKWLAQALKNAQEALENSSMTMQLEEDSHATPFEQVYA